MKCWIQFNSYSHKTKLKQLTAKMLQSVFWEKNSKEVSPPLSKGLIFSFLLEYLMAPPFFKRYSSISTELSVALVFVPWSINVFFPFSTCTQPITYKVNNFQAILHKFSIDSNTRIKTHDSILFCVMRSKKTYQLRSSLLEYTLRFVGLGSSYFHHDW